MSRCTRVFAPAVTLAVALTVAALLAGAVWSDQDPGPAETAGTAHTMHTARAAGITDAARIADAAGIPGAADPARDTAWSPKVVLLFPRGPGASASVR